MRSSCWRIQQKYGDSPIQSIVTGLHERSRRGIIDGLRRFIQADNHSVVDVGHVRQGTRSLKVQKPHFCEAFPEADIMAWLALMRRFDATHVIVLFTGDFLQLLPGLSSSFASVDLSCS